MNTEVASRVQRLTRPANKEVASRVQKTTVTEVASDNLGDLLLRLVGPQSPEGWKDTGVTRSETPRWGDFSYNRLSRRTQGECEDVRYKAGPKTMCSRRPAHARNPRSEREDGGEPESSPPGQER